MKKTNNGITELVFILDKSGSMSGLESDTIGGFNSMIAKQKKEDGKVYVSTVLFSDRSTVLYDRADIGDIPAMTDKDYLPGGCTALLDATGGAIRHISRVHGYLPDEYRPEKTIFVIITDGYENASRTYSYPKVREMIEQKKAEGWEFLFLGANIDAIGEAAKIGIASDRAATYLADDIGQHIAYEAVADATCAMRSAPCGAQIDSDWKANVERDTRKRKSSRFGAFSRR